MKTSGKYDALEKKLDAIDFCGAVEDGRIEAHATVDRFAWARGGAVALLKASSDRVRAFWEAFVDAKAAFGALSAISDPSDDAGRYDAEELDAIRMQNIRTADEATRLAVAMKSALASVKRELSFVETYNAIMAGAIDDELTSGDTICYDDLSDEGKARFDAHDWAIRANEAMSAAIGEQLEDAEWLTADCDVANEAIDELQSKLKQAA